MYFILDCYGFGTNAVNMIKKNEKPNQRFRIVGSYPHPFVPTDKFAKFSH
jgi:hypothetical protein